MTSKFMTVSKKRQPQKFDKLEKSYYPIRLIFINIYFACFRRCYPIFVHIDYFTKIHMVPQLLTCLCCSNLPNHLNHFHSLPFVIVYQPFICLTNFYHQDRLDNHNLSRVTGFFIWTSYTSLFSNPFILQIYCMGILEYRD